MSQGITVNMPVTITEEMLNQVFVDAIEGGTGYWAQVREYRWDMETWGTGWLARVVDIEQDCDADDDAVNVHVIDRNVIVRGIERAAADGRYRHHVRNLAAGDDDAETGDVIVQFGLFGQMIYG